MQIFWIKLNKLFYRDFLNEIKSDLVEPPSPLIRGNNLKQKIIFTPNPEILLNTLKDKEFKEILQKANYLTIDWIGIYIWLQIKENPLAPLSGGIWIIVSILLLPYHFFNLFFRRKYLYKKYWERICGSDLTKDLVEFANKDNIKITIIDPFFPKDKNKCKAQKNFISDLKKVFPKLDFDYFIYNHQNLENINHPENLEVLNLEKIINKISASNSKILFSTLWMKTQEKSVVEIMKKCLNIKVWLGIGSSFDYFTWFQKRAPKIFRVLGLEWLYRLITWPQKIKRLKRLYNAIFVFIWKVLTVKVKWKFYE